ncbi:MAG: hypothetical protein IPO90_16055 [Flavobacteriales bacterium]|nr:hypothetical protein [Flavobacteriales bacterium]
MYQFRNPIIARWYGLAWVNTFNATVDNLQNPTDNRNWSTSRRRHDEPK